MNSIKKHISALIFSTASVAATNAQTANDLNEGLKIVHNSVLDEVTVTWWTKPDFFYFLLTTEDLADDPWAYFDYAVLGDSSAQGIVMSLAGSKLFFRVSLTNDVNSPLLILDQDGDKVSTADELLQGTDPFLSQSLDADTIPDDWEVFHGLDTTPGVDSSGDDAEPDGATTLTEYTLDLDPSLRDHPDITLNIH